MYSALYATDCQEKRLLILAVLVAKSNLDVKNLSYLLPSFTKEISSGSEAAEKCPMPSYPTSWVITEVFPKMANSCWKSGGVPVTINHSRFDRPV